MPEGLVAYAVLPAGHAPPARLRGPGNVPVGSLEEAGVALWVSRHDHAPRPDVEAARAHHEVVAAALAMGVTPVPLRFGQWLAGRERALEVVREKAPRWRDDLERLAGTVEMGVRARVSTETGAARSVHAPQGGSGTEYLRSVADRHAESRAMAERAEALAGELVAAAGPWARDTRVEVLRAPPGAVSIAILVGRSDAPPLREALHAAARAAETAEFAVTGPWPPYSFT